MENLEVFFDLERESPIVLIRSKLLPSTSELALIR